MKKGAFALIAALPLIAAAPALAQDTTGVDPACIMKNADGTSSVDMTKCPDGKTAAKGTEAAPDSNTGDAATTTEGTAATTNDGNAATTTEGTAATPTTEQPADTTAAEAPKTDIIVVPAEQLNGVKLMTASDYIGKRVYDRAGSDIGEVNDLILSADGKIQATILGVGGFLGIGEKNVAVPVTAVEMVQDGSAVRLVVNASKQQLEQAPTYDPANRRYAG
jgi:sporulation protein YlmC with PRC-barrel domain